ncbi:MAG: hypothetical protein M3209_17955 [Acidobacteriota bacterium]|nr:hypothetical protein [Acidobacteriota bacterium]
MRKPVIIRSLNFGLACAAFVLAFGAANPSVAQERDPFRKPVIAARKKASSKAPVSSVKKPEKVAPTVVAAPPIQQRIENYKTLRMRAAELGLPAPKPTAVLTVSEVEVTGIFRTPRGYSAMVEATPINLSYTIYPGEKFYDGYLVAIEENRLVFRRETRMSDGKSFTVAENKGLKVPMMNDMLVPRTETAENKEAAPTVNPTVTVPAAAAAAANNQGPVLTADNKTKPETNGVQIVEGAKNSSPENEQPASKPTRRINPRKSK